MKNPKEAIRPGGFYTIFTKDSRSMEKSTVILAYTHEETEAGRGKGIIRVKGVSSQDPDPGRLPAEPQF